MYHIARNVCDDLNFTGYDFFSDFVSKISFTVQFQNHTCDKILFFHYFQKTPHNLSASDSAPFLTPRALAEANKQVASITDEESLSHKC